MAGLPDFDAERKHLAGVSKIVVKKSVMAGVLVEHTAVLETLTRVCLTLE
jgi:hypothetical protein